MLKSISCFCRIVSVQIVFIAIFALPSAQGGADTSANALVPSYFVGEAERTKTSTGEWSKSRQEIQAEALKNALQAIISYLGIRVSYSSLDVAQSDGNTEVQNVEATLKTSANHLIKIDSRSIDNRWSRDSVGVERVSVRVPFSESEYYETLQAYINWSLKEIDPLFISAETALQQSQWLSAIERYHDIVRYEDEIASLRKDIAGAGLLKEKISRARAALKTQLSCLSFFVRNDDFVIATEAPFATPPSVRVRYTCRNGDFPVSGFRFSVEALPENVSIQTPLVTNERGQAFIKVRANLKPLVKFKVQIAAEPEFYRRSGAHLRAFLFTGKIVPLRQATQAIVLFDVPSSDQHVKEVIEDQIAIIARKAGFPRVTTYHQSEADSGFAEDHKQLYELGNTVLIQIQLRDLSAGEIKPGMVMIHGNLAIRVVSLADGNELGNYDASHTESCKPAAKYTIGLTKSKGIADLVAKQICSEDLLGFFRDSANSNFDN